MKFGGWWNMIFFASHQSHRPAQKNDSPRHHLFFHLVPQRFLHNLELLHKLYAFVYNHCHVWNLNSGNDVCQTFNAKNLKIKKNTVIRFSSYYNKGFFFVFFNYRNCVVSTVIFPGPVAPDSGACKKIKVKRKSGATGPGFLFFVLFLRKRAWKLFLF